LVADPLVRTSCASADRPESSAAARCESLRELPRESDGGLGDERISSNDRMSLSSTNFTLLLRTSFGGWSRFVSALARALRPAEFQSPRAPVARSPGRPLPHALPAFSTVVGGREAGNSAWKVVMTGESLGLAASSVEVSHA